MEWKFEIKLYYEISWHQSSVQTQYKTNQNVFYLNVISIYILYINISIALWSIYWSQFNCWPRTKKSQLYFTINICLLHPFDIHFILFYFPKTLFFKYSSCWAYVSESECMCKRMWICACVIPFCNICVFIPIDSTSTIQ